MRPRVVIAGTGSGVGKTTIVTGLMARLSREMGVQGYKVGPDFIDPMFHTAVTGRPSRNLDSFFMGRDTLENLYGWSSIGADISVIEGVRGLYEGSTATGDKGSTAEIAKILDAPVVLVVDAKSLTKSAAAIVRGFVSLDPDVNIAGVILNRIRGERHRSKAVEAVESLTDVPVLGTVERVEDSMPERHLGLVTMPERDRREVMDHTVSLVEDIDLDMLMGIAEGASERHFDVEDPFPVGDSSVSVGVPRDVAFSFYYRENIESLERAGARVVEFSPVAGDALPDCDAYYLGGGYPEEHLEEISGNTDFLEGLWAASMDGRTILGECGGMMTLCRSIERDGVGYPMAGVLETNAVQTRGRQGLSYVRATATAENPIMEGDVVGHEFHYSKLDPLPKGPFAYDVGRGVGIDGRHDGIVKGRTVGQYMHQHALSRKDWGIRFVGSVSP